jgi:two-component system response regulator YesN
VCADLHISPGYFSSIFKRETKTTFVTYLLQLRMEKAKELLRTTDLKTFEIAEQVGYSDANYFSFCFRKHVGLSAKEYRNSSGKEE